METEDQGEIRKLKNRISQYQNRLSNKSTAKDMEEKIKAKNKCIMAMMNAMDNVLKVNAKIEIVNILTQDTKTQLQKTFKACEEQSY